MVKSTFHEEYNDDTAGSKLARKSKDSPFLVAGLIGLVTVCGIGAYKFKHRGEMSTSVFLMQLRVAAQGTVVGALSLGLAYTMANRFLFKTNDSDEK
ncbi:HIG1 domain family member 1A, mitochondrial-like [Bradysia coprophila]|uniref:HIG1 domain family member 1A, mitochondrial-like n=1 Tax=Bradysia coprophila TaxID=38358 RepID=UPI00187D782D|nr:HIG1 domain family member 1A, mitochondrial-like [Bradysia coprophila]